MGEKEKRINTSIPDKALRREMLRRSWPLLRPHLLELFLATLAMMVAAFLDVFRPWPLKVVLDRVLSQRPSRVPFIHVWLDNAPFTRMQVLYGACGATVVIALLAGLLAYYYTKAMGSVGQHYVFGLRRDLFAHLQRLSLRFHDHQRTGDLTLRLMSDIKEIQEMIAGGMSSLATNICLLLGMLGLMLWVNWKFALVSLWLSPFLFLTVFRYRRRIKAASRKARKSTGLLASLAQETLASIRIVQGLAQEDRVDERFQAQSENHHQASLDLVRYQARITPLVDTIATLGVTVVIWYGATRVMAGQLTTGDIVLFFAYVSSLYSPMKSLARFSTDFDKANVAAERIAEVMLIRSEVADRPGARKIAHLAGGIEFRDVSFEYEPGQPVLSGVNLAIAPGEKVAVVGATGAGKSTLVSLIPRFYDPTRGEVRIDGQDIRNYALQSLREQISLVLQDSLLFNGSIRENIAFGCPDASDEQIAAAAVTANADEFIQRLPEGYETPVAERGTTLSGGQKQRIAVARAILRDAPILLLDEPTSSLDSSSEQVVMEALERAAQGRTTLIIAHRLSTARLADRIVVLDRGRIVEEGSHFELLARNGKYARFYHLQIMTGADTAAALLESDVAVDETDWLPPYRALYKTGSRPAVIDNTLPPPAYSSGDEPGFSGNRTAQNSGSPAGAESVNSEEADENAGYEPSGS
jgi:ATP-binding cassette subfamily B protein